MTHENISVSAESRFEMPKISRVSGIFAKIAFFGSLLVAPGNIEAQTIKGMENLQKHVRECRLYPKTCQDEKKAGMDEIITDFRRGGTSEAVLLNPDAKPSVLCEKTAAWISEAGTDLWTIWNGFLKKYLQNNSPDTWPADIKIFLDDLRMYVDDSKTDQDYGPLFKWLDETIRVGSDGKMHCELKNLGQWFMAHSIKGYVEKSQVKATKAIAALAELLKSRDESDIGASQAANALMSAIVKAAKPLKQEDIRYRKQK